MNLCSKEKENIEESVTRKRRPGQTRRELRRIDIYQWRSSHLPLH